MAFGLDMAAWSPVLPGEKPDEGRVGQTRPGWTGFVVQLAEMYGEFRDKKMFNQTKKREDGALIEWGKKKDEAARWDKNEGRPITNITTTGILMK